jgi:hypothetical protein
MRYPNYESFDMAIRSGEVVWQDYIGSPTVIPDANPTPAEAGSSNVAERPEGSLQSEPATGDNSNAQVDSAGLTLPNGYIPTGTVWTQDSAPQTRSGFGELAQNLTGQALEAKLAIKDKVGMKERAWYPIVAAIHSGLMWFAKAKANGTSFKLSRDQKKLLALGYQCSIGDSPLLKLRKKGWGDLDTPDAITANLEVYGEWIFENGDGIFTHGSELFYKFRNRKSKVVNVNGFPSTQPA